MGTVCAVKERGLFFPKFTQTKKGLKTVLARCDLKASACKCLLFTV